MINLERFEQTILGQLRPANTTAVSISSPNAGELIYIDHIIVANTTTANAKYRIFLDVDGTTYDQTTALVYDALLPGETTDIVPIDLPLFNYNGNLAVRTDTNSALTFTAKGRIKQ